MSKLVSIVLILCGSALVAIVPLWSIITDLNAMEMLHGSMDMLHDGGQFHLSKSLPAGYAWAMFALGVMMILLGTLTAWSSRTSANASGK